jgi:Skp family chaperone for outer membrane proteins
LRELQKELNGPKGSLSPKARRLKEKEFAKETQDFQDAKNHAQDELEARNREMTRMLMEQIKEIVAETAKKEGMDLVLDSNGSVATQSGTDLTGEVLRAFSKLEKESADTDPSSP